ncbi:MAG: gluconeogenesis factor YvcK family protein [bacterium]|jgi:uncharacterized cofD-like protein
MRRIRQLMTPGIGIKRWLFLFFLGLVLTAVGIATGVGTGVLGRLESLAIDTIFLATGRFLPPWVRGILSGAAGVTLCLYSLLRLVHAMLSVLAPQNKKGLLDALYQKRQLGRGPRIVVLGGGTGLSVLLRGLKEYTSNLTAIVTVADDGGSSGRLRNDFGILPPGDIRNCLLALADTEPLLEKLFQYRFGQGKELAGHSFGNLFIAAMTEITGDFELAVRESSKVLAVRGRVYPSTLTSVRLHAEYSDGTGVAGESNIPQPGKKIKRVFLQPPDCRPTEEALAAVREAEIIILGPGSLYTSILPNLLVTPLPAALRASRALKVYVCNIMTQPGETDDYTAGDHLRVVSEYLGPGTVDCILVNTRSLPLRLQRKYEAQGAYPVTVDRRQLEEMGVRTIEADLISTADHARHDPGKLAAALLRLSGDLRS